ncbi:MAG: YjjG family noncanonical pyrimidine nucleotidase [Chitinophagaceae bacterium]
MYKHLFFDLDHTLWDFDTNSRETMLRIYRLFDLESRGITDFDAFYNVYNDHNDRLWGRFRKGFIKRDELRWKRMWHTLLDFQVPHTQTAHEMSSAYLEILPTQKALIPNAKEVLEYCSSKYKLHIITNGFETTQTQKLVQCGLKQYFSELITSEKSNAIKPQRDIFLYAQQAAGAGDVNECLMIGDALEIDVLGAMGAGWDAVYFNPGKIAHNAKPTYEIDALQTLLSIV